MILARVVLPEPGGPQKMQEPTSPRRIKSPSAFPGPSKCSCPRNWSKFFGRMRAANGWVEPWKSVGSVTQFGTRETGNGTRRHEMSLGMHQKDPKLIFALIILYA